VKVVSIEEPEYDMLDGVPRSVDDADTTTVSTEGSGEESAVSVSQTSLSRIIELTHQLERTRISDRSRAGRVNKVAKGERECGGAPLGYDWVKHKLAVNETEARTVKLIYEKFLETRVIKKTVEYLNSGGHKTKHGRVFTRQGVSAILRNKTYTGVLCKGEVEIPGTHEMIITPEIFSEVRSKLRVRTCQVKEK
jgi:hypothetical protein